MSSQTCPDELKPWTRPPTRLGEKGLRGRTRTRVMAVGLTNCMPSVHWVMVTSRPGGRLRAVKSRRPEEAGKIESPAVEPRREKKVDEFPSNPQKGSRGDRQGGASVEQSLGPRMPLQVKVVEGQLTGLTGLTTHFFDKPDGSVDNLQPWPLTGAGVDVVGAADLTAQGVDALEQAPVVLNAGTSIGQPSHLGPSHEPLADRVVAEFVIVGDGEGGEEVSTDGLVDLLCSFHWQPEELRQQAGKARARSTSLPERLLPFHRHRQRRGSGSQVVSERDIDTEHLRDGQLEPSWAGVRVAESHADVSVDPGEEFERSVVGSRAERDVSLQVHIPSDVELLAGDTDIGQAEQVPCGQDDPGDVREGDVARLGCRNGADLRVGGVVLVDDEVQVGEGRRVRATEVHLALDVQPLQFDALEHEVVRVARRDNCPCSVREDHPSVASQRNLIDEAVGRRVGGQVSVYAGERSRSQRRKVNDGDWIPGLTSVLEDEVVLAPQPQQQIHVLEVPARDHGAVGLRQLDLARGCGDGEGESGRFVPHVEVHVLLLVCLQPAVRCTRVRQQTLARDLRASLPVEPGGQRDLDGRPWRIHRDGSVRGVAHDGQRWSKGALGLNDQPACCWGQSVPGDGDGTARAHAQVLDRSLDLCCVRAGPRAGVVKAANPVDILSPGDEADAGDHVAVGPVAGQVDKLRRAGGELEASCYPSEGEGLAVAVEVGVPERGADVASLQGKRASCDVPARDPSTLHGQQVQLTEGVGCCRRRRSFALGSIGTPAQSRTSATTLDIVAGSCRSCQSRAARSL
eukprot:758786-Hanusia_phi.AAC.2